jgi:multiple sugar transport system ATP-binding protein
MASVTVRGIEKWYGNVQIIHGVDIDIEDEEFVVLVGPSGCGKSTLLRMIAGLETITKGEISIGPRIINDVPPRNRDIAMVFQNYALYPHMTVSENIGFSLKLRKKSKEEITKKIGEAAEILNLGPYLQRSPRQLSGGQRQRVAMGRALVRDAQVFLYDEPLSNLDAKLRVVMRTEIKALHQRLKTTSVYVTHDQIEAMTMADRIVVMNKGRVEQVGTPEEVFNHPANAFVMDFLGNVNVFKAELKDGRVLLGNVEMPVGSNTFGSPDGSADVFIRPHELDIDRSGTKGNCIQGKIMHINPAGSTVKVRVRAEEFGLMVNVDITPDRHRELALIVGEAVYLSPKAGKVFQPDYSI